MSTTTDTAPVIYKCTNTSCRLGSRVDSGFFTGGLSESQAVALFGDDAKHGPNVCPNCGETGTKTNETFEPLIGKDPFQEVHDVVNVLVLTPDHPLTGDQAQEVAQTAIAIIEDDSNTITKADTAVDHALSAVGLDEKKGA